MIMPQPKKNYALELERLAARLQAQNQRPRLLLHVCCAPCLSGCIEYLAARFQVTLFFYNPNITPQAEHDKRLAEVVRLCNQMPLASPVEILPGAYEPQAFRSAAQGLEDAPEGGPRCRQCFRLRLDRTAQAARAGGFDFFTTTLSISPLKDAQALNAIGEEVGAAWGVAHLPADFKKRDGFKRSVERSREYGLYRQDFCGCGFSRRERAEKSAK